MVNNHYKLEEYTHIFFNDVKKREAEENSLDTKLPEPNVPEA